ncbi:putative O-methyltransferase [Actinacidiphila reveromycinica]|uniref:Putative O-methyltransferase n=1 Tax=Actinacidiphila reveromycinica TaxID=659352 RepID=A0A7U3VN39_9ACTN|nr:methyltransferase [Streptomyces sp. SN-593]BBA97265.1 putative O-methyltransferase [Streptomyces sp. SN-593]
MSKDELTPSQEAPALPPEFATLMRLGDLVTPMALRVAARLRLVDHLRGGVHDVESLAKATGSHQQALGRLIRHLVAVEVLEESEPGHYTPTALGELLAHDHPVTQVGWLDPTHMIGRADLALIHLFEAVRDGRPVYERQYGKEFWEDVSADPVLSATFYDLMAHGQKHIFGLAVAQHDWSGARHLLDVGGGDGDLIATLLAAEPGIRGTLVELPGPAARARTKFEEAGLAGRAEVVAGSFFDPLPVTADVIALSFVLHNWSDQDAVRILRNCAQALEPGGSLLLIECAEQSPSAPDPAFTSGDLRMMVYFEGRERTHDQWRELATAAGMRIDSVSGALAYGARVLTLVKASS